MTYEEALDFFARYGNVCGDPDRLRLERPTEQNLIDAVYVATNPPHNQPEEVAKAAREAILDHYNGELTDARKPRL